MRFYDTFLSLETETTTVVSTVTESTTGAVTTTEEMKTTIVTTAAGEELTNVSTSASLVSTTPGYCLEPVDEQAGLEVEQATEGKSSIDETTGAWKVRAPKKKDTEKTPKLLTQFSKPTVVTGIRLTNVANAGGVAPGKKVVLSLIIAFKSPGDEEFIEVREERTGQPVSCFFYFRLLVSSCFFFYLKTNSAGADSVT